MMFMLGLNEPPKRVLSTGGILRWKDGRNMPDVHATLFEYGDIPIYFRLISAPSLRKSIASTGFQGHSRSHRIRSHLLSANRQGRIPQLLLFRFPPRHARRIRQQMATRSTNPAPGKEPGLQGFTFRSVSWDEEKPHLWTYFQAVRTAASPTSKT